MIDKIIRLEAFKKEILECNEQWLNKLLHANKSFSFKQQPDATEKFFWASNEEIEADIKVITILNNSYKTKEELLQAIQTQIDELKTII